MDPTRTSVFRAASPPHLLAALLATMSLSYASSARAQASAPPVVDEPSSATAVSTDYLFAPRGGFSATFAAGIPLLGIGELAYGVTDRLALGAVVAGTPDLPGAHGTAAVGVRPRGILFERGSWRSVLVVPVLYYPKVPGFGDSDPWVLTRPTLTLEKTFASGVRMSGELGLIAAACTESLLTLGMERTRMGGVWNTAGVGGAVPFSARTSLFVEASLILNGIAPASDWIGGSPVVAMAGVATKL
jgi:hypothetical protein